MAAKKIEFRLFGETLITHSEEELNIQESDRKGSEVTISSNDDHKDTVLRLSCGSSSHDVEEDLNIQESDQKGSEVTTSSNDDHKDTVLRLFCGSSFHDVEEDVNIQEFDRKGIEVATSSSDDHEDTALRLSSGSSSHVSGVGQYKKKGRFLEDQLALALRGLDIAGPSNCYIVHGRSVHGPMPSRSFPTTSPCVCGGQSKSFDLKLSREYDEKGIDNSATGYAGEGSWRNIWGETQNKPSEESQDKGTQNSSSSNMNSDENRGESVKRKGKRIAVRDDKYGSKSVKARKRSTIAPHKTTEPIPTIEQVPRLLGIIESQNWTQPVFLYRKKLQESDVRKDQNRIFLTQCEQLMEFLTEEERRTVYETKGGLEVYAVDQEEKFYKLQLARWGSLGMLVLKSQWWKLVECNNVETGFWVEMWGYRSNGKFGLAVNFRKPAEELVSSDRWD
ncbi:hypothetical protein CDL12_27184 [Handroanthus impetiginosus]|uniref:TF-B3 domain-containing protein n=1 Tax=Handroanthus impetiginosus TaxID=429701 RepID=A0A2G9G546_9LAMI|nr:hypothetical protein CDL12_27184 [Handroanthus impetiginosus]